MDWQPAQDVPCLLPDDNWDKFQCPLHDPEKDKLGIENGIENYCYNPIFI